MGKIPPHAQGSFGNKTGEHDRTPHEMLGTIGTTEGEKEWLSGS